MTLCSAYMGSSLYFTTIILPIYSLHAFAPIGTQGSAAEKGKELVGAVAE